MTEPARLPGPTKPASDGERARIPPASPAATSVRRFGNWSWEERRCWGSWSSWLDQDRQAAPTAASGDFHEQWVKRPVGCTSFISRKAWPWQGRKGICGVLRLIFLSRAAAANGCGLQRFARPHYSHKNLNPFTITTNPVNSMAIQTTRPDSLRQHQRQHITEVMARLR